MFESGVNAVNCLGTNLSMRLPVGMRRGGVWRGFAEHHACGGIPRKEFPRVQEFVVNEKQLALSFPANRRAF